MTFKRYIPSEKSALGKDGGPGEKETALVRQPRPKAAAVRARCDEGSYGHRQQR